MEQTENKEVTSPRKKLAERLSKRFPDKKFMSDDAQGVQNGQDALDDMAQSALEYLDEYDEKNKVNEENYQKLTELFETDDVAAQFMNDWATTGDPIKSLVKIFGEDSVREAFESEDGRKGIESFQKEYLQKKEEAKRIEEERDATFMESLKALDEFGTQKNLSDEVKGKIITYLINLSNAALDGKFTTEDYQMVYNALYHDNDVNSAKEEGMINGRNEKIREFRRDKNKPTAAIPSFNRQPAPMQSPQKSDKKTAGDLFML